MPFGLIEATKNIYEVFVHKSNEDRILLRPMFIAADGRPFGGRLYMLRSYQETAGIYLTLGVRNLGLIRLMSSIEDDNRHEETKRMNYE